MYKENQYFPLVLLFGSVDISDKMQREDTIMKHKRMIKRLVAALLITVLLMGNVFHAMPSMVSAYARTTHQQNLNLSVNDSLELECVLESITYQDAKAASSIKSYVREGTHYLFLPSYINLASTKVNMENASENIILLDGRTQKQWEEHVLTAGQHMVSVNGQETTLMIMQSKNVASMFIHTDGQLEELYKDKKNTTTGNMTLFDADGAIGYNGALSQIKCRGNSTFHLPKKPYQIKLPAATDLLGMGEAKTWILLANYYDVTSLRNQIVFDMAKAAGLKYTPEGDWVDLYINGDYCGIYLLSEKVQIGKNRVDIHDLEKDLKNANPDIRFDELPRFGVNEGEKGGTKGVIIPNVPSDVTGGYLLEVDVLNRYAEEVSGFVTKGNQAVVMKSPEYADKSQVDYMADIFQQFEDAVCSKYGVNPVTKRSYREYFDMDSFIKRYIVDEITRNIDAGLTSSFYYKPQGESKVYAGPIWDYDVSMGIDWGSGLGFTGLGYQDFAYDAVNWYTQLYKFPSFRNQVARIYQETFMPVMKELIEKKIPEYGVMLEDALAMNQVRWPVDSCCRGYEEDLRYVHDFLEQRTEWLAKTWVENDEKDEVPEVEPTKTPEVVPTQAPSAEPTKTPEVVPTQAPSAEPTKTPEVVPTQAPSAESTQSPSAKPSIKPTATPSPSIKPTPSIKPKITITLDKKMATLYTSGVTTVKLKTTVKGTTTKPTFRSSNKNIVKVSGSGTVTAVKAGSATITASVNGVKATCKVTVKKPTLIVAKDKVTIKKGNRYRLKVKATPSKTITYSSSNKKIVTVDKNGVIKGIKPGKAIITVTANQVSKKVTITCKK